MIIKTKSITSLLVSGFQFGDDNRDRYRVLCGSEKIKYRAYPQNTISGREILDVYDDKGNKIGYIKEHLVSARVLGIEEKAKTCSVYFESEQIATIRYSVEKVAGYRERDINASGGPYRVTCDIDTFERNLKIYQGKELLARVCQKLQSFKKGYIDKLFVEYYGDVDEKIIVLLSIAIDMVS